MKMMTLRVLFDTIEARSLAALINTAQIEVDHLNSTAVTPADFARLAAFDLALDSFKYAWTFLEIEASPAAFAHAWDDFLTSVSPVFKYRANVRVNKTIKTTMTETNSSFMRNAPSRDDRNSAFVGALDNLAVRDRELVFA